MSTDAFDLHASADPVVDAGPFGVIPRVDGRQARLGSMLARLPGPARLLGSLGEAVEFGPPEVASRASGLGRPGVIAHFSWPRRSARLGLGLETAPAHAWVDRLLGFERRIGESHLQVTPVEFGILQFVVEEILKAISASAGDLGPLDLVLDRLGPDPFDPSGLGVVFTIRWPVAIGREVGSLRLWAPMSMLDALRIAPASRLDLRAERSEALIRLDGTWIARAGTATIPRGLGRLRVGGILPIDDAPLGGTVASPVGVVDLSLRTSDATHSFAAGAEADSGGGRLVLLSPIRREPSPREPISVDTPPETTAIPAAPDVPVTLVVELGRVNLTLSRVADLRPGDVVELGRHAREPVELTSGGRLVARGELVQIDTELGIRVTSVFL